MYILIKAKYKDGVELPKSVKETYILGMKNGNTFWADAIATEMKYVRVAFDILSEAQSSPIGYQQMMWHMILDVKMKDFWRKARLIADKHITYAHDSMTYAKSGVMQDYAHCFDHDCP